MSKDSYWFKHDSTAGRGTRLRKIAFIYGHWGKGIYWDVIEMLRDQSDYKYECDEFSLKMLADLIGCKDEGKFINWFKDCVKFELFCVENGYFFSEVLVENMARWESSKINGSKGGRPKGKKPKKNLTNNPNETQTKPKRNQTINLNETIIEENSIEDNSTLKKEKTKKEKIDGFLNWFNLQKKEHTGTIGKFKGLSSTDVNNLFKLLKNYNYKDFEEAIPKMFANEWAKETNNLTPTHFLRNDNFNKYLNAEIKKEIIGLG